MIARTYIEGRLAPLDRANVDTDQIMAKQHLKRIDRHGFGEVIFEDWRRDPSFVLNDPRFSGATILVAGENFGAGSSREHAVWGLQQYGFEAVISPRFADIFRTNADRCGLLAVELPHASVAALMRAAEDDPATSVAIDIVGQRVHGPGGLDATFAVNSYTKVAITKGWDFIDMTMRFANALDSFESEHLPKVFPARVTPTEASNESH